MKQIVLFLYSVILLAACKPKDTSGASVTADATPSTSVLAAGNVTFNGTIKGLDTGYAELLHQEDNMTKMDPLKLVKGTFSFTTKLEEPMQFALRIRGAEEVQPLVFFADPGIISINGNIDSLHKAEVRGGTTQDEFRKTSDGLNRIFGKAEPYYQKFSQAKQNGDAAQVQKIQKFFDSLTAEANQFVLDYAAGNRSSLVAATLLGMNLNNGGNTDQLAGLYEAFSEPVKNSQPGRNLKAALDAKKNTSAGAVAVDFTQNDVNGKPVSLSSFKGKYLLLDFWASWCGPCRAENPNVVAAYNHFKTKGFEILGVSLDESRNAWLEAIAKDKLSWKHVSDLKGWENAAARIYRIQSIPANFLLDKNGKIVARDLRGEELEKKLRELMP